MTIQVTCQKCHKRFQVGEKFAGRTGLCPNCKAPIRVPTAAEEVVIHAPDNYGPKDAKGQAVLKPIAREEVTASPVVVVGIVGSIIVAIVVGIVLRQLYPQEPNAEHVTSTLWWTLATGSMMLAPPLVYAGYWFLRNDELEPHRGMGLAIRVVICSVIYAGLWGLYAGAKQYLFSGRPPEMFHFALLGPAFLGVGGFAGLATLELDFGSGAMHYAFYLLVTVLFCFLVGVPPY